MELTRWKIVAAGLNGALAVAFAAFGAHGLPADLPDRLRDAYATGAELHLAHAALLAALAFQTRFRTAFLVVCAGTFLFSGSLYALTLTGERSLAVAAPVGGLLLIAGWIAMAMEGWRSRET